MSANDLHVHDARTAEERTRPFLPGMGKTWLLPLYDMFSAVAGVRRLHDEAAHCAAVARDERVLDVGCGTANLSLAVLRAAPGARVTGLDPDASALRRAARKARRRRVPLHLVQGYADRLPGDDGSIDHVISSLALHHIDAAGRSGFAREAFRVLRARGRVTVLDFGGPGHDGEALHERRHQHGHGLGGVMARLRRRAMHHARLAPNLDNGIVTLLLEAGFADVGEVRHIEHRLGQITIVQATRP